MKFSVLRHVTTPKNVFELFAKMDIIVRDEDFRNMKGEMN